jgi:uncharacterized protein (TIGR02231 family)
MKSFTHKYLNIIIIFLLLITHFTKAKTVFEPTDEPTYAQAKIDSVTLFLNGAQIFSSGVVSVKTGQSEIIFTGISTSILQKTLRISAPQDMKVLTVSLDILPKEHINLQLQMIQDSMRLVADQITLYKNELDVLSEEKKLILANNQVETNGTLSIQRLEELSALYRRKLKEINDKTFGINKSLVIQEKTLKELKDKENKIFQKENKTNKIIKIVIESSRNQSAQLMIQYMVINAVWKPTYLLKIDEIDKPIDLEYLAQVYNNTGNDWDNVPITLATVDPTQSAENPSLQAWTLNYQSHISTGEGRLNDAKIVINDGLEYPTGFADFEEIEVSDLNITFKLEKKHTIPSDAVPHTIFIQNHHLKANYKHLSIPKIKQGAYFIAKITDWEDLNLIEGPMTLFFQNTYVGESSLHTNIISDTLEMSLGKDNRVTVLRTKLIDQSSKKLLGSNIKETMTYEIALKNNYNSVLTLDLLDQVPISQDKEIQVNLLDLAGAEHDELSGKLTWKVRLNPGEQKKIRFSFDIKYPKNKQLDIIKNKNMIRTPRYF